MNLAKCLLTGDCESEAFLLLFLHGDYGGVFSAGGFINDKETTTTCGTGGVSCFSRVLYWDEFEVV